MSARPNLAEKLKHCMAESGDKPPDIAELCGVRVPSVYDWLQHGRIAKRHLPTLAKHFGYPLSWWLDATDEEDMLSKDERVLLESFRAMRPEQRQTLAALIEAITKRQELSAPDADDG